METRIKLSGLTYEFLESVGLSEVSMHTDCSDVLLNIRCKDALESAKKELMDGYGDVDLVINPEVAWSRQIWIDDAKWQADHEAFCKEKAAWCAKHGCD